MWNASGIAVPTSGPPAAGTSASGLAYAQALAQAAENVHRPHVPAVLTVADRQVYVENVEAPPAGYTLLRRWMRNDPEVDVESIVGPATSALLLPGPLELSTEGVHEPPPLVDDVDDYDPEQAVVDLKRHWVRQRKYTTALRLKRVDRCRDRLKLVAAANTLAVTQLLAAQQHPGATLQQQQLLQLQQHQQHQQAAAAAVKQAAGLTSTQPMVQQPQATVLLQLPPHAVSAMQQHLIKQEAGATVPAAAAPTPAEAAASDAVPDVDPTAAAAMTVTELHQDPAAAAAELGPDPAAAAATAAAADVDAAGGGQDASQVAAGDADMQAHDGQHYQQQQQGDQAAADAAVAAAHVSQAEAGAGF